MYRKYYTDTPFAFIEYKDKTTMCEESSECTWDEKTGMPILYCDKHTDTDSCKLFLENQKAWEKGLAEYHYVNCYNDNQCKDRYPITPSSSIHPSAINDKCDKTICEREPEKTDPAYANFLKLCLPVKDKNCDKTVCCVEKNKDPCYLLQSGEDWVPKNCSSQCCDKEDFVLYSKNLDQYLSNILKR